nr:salicylic acid-binding protein 2-like [Ipomoea batatas]
MLFFLQSAETAAESPTDDQLRPNKSEKHFVLVHGSCHGAWSWYKVVAMLRSSGHNVTALDLGASGINPLQALQIPHQSDYFRPLMLFLPLRESYSESYSWPHSLGGLAISKAMETFPTKDFCCSFCTAIMPGPPSTFPTLTAQVWYCRFCYFLFNTNHTYLMANYLVM